MVRIIMQSVTDQTAASELGSIVSSFAKKLKNLCGEPAIILMQYERYNNGTHHVWFSSNRKEAHWHSFCDDKLNDQPNRISYRSSYDTQMPDVKIDSLGARMSHDIFGELKAILDELELSRWQKLSNQAFSSKEMPLLGICNYADLVWFLRGSKDEKSNEAWCLLEDLSLIHIGEPFPLTKRYTSNPPISFRDIDIKAISKLPLEAQQVLFPMRSNEQVLAEQLKKMILDIREHSSSKISFIRVQETNKYENFQKTIYIIDSEKIYKDPTSYSVPHITKIGTKIKLDETVPDNVVKIASDLDKFFSSRFFPSSAWSNLFMKAFNYKISEYDSIRFQVSSDSFKLAIGFSLFKFEKNLLVFDKIMTKAELEIEFSPSVPD